MNTFTRTSALLTVLASLAAVPALAGESILVTHDEGNSGPYFAQVENRSAPEALAARTGLVLHDEGNSGPEVISAQPAGHQAKVSHQGQTQVVVRDDGQSAPQVFIR